MSFTDPFKQSREGAQRRRQLVANIYRREIYPHKSGRWKDGRDRLRQLIASRRAEIKLRKERAKLLVATEGVSAQPVVPQDKTAKTPRAVRASRSSGLYKRGNVYHYDITLDGKRLRGSTKQKDEYLAKLFLNDRIAEARKRGVDAIIRKPPVLREFAKDFQDWVKNSQNLEPKTKTYYLHGLGMLLTAKIADMRVDYIRNHDCETLHFEGGNYNANCALRTLRRLFSKAKELGKLPEVPNIKLRKELPRTIAMSMPDATLIASHMTGDPRDALLVMRGTGCRPEECFRMRWEYAHVDKGYYQNPNGKTKSSRRAIPLLWDSIEVLARRHAEQGSPREGWVFPAKSKTGHMVTILKAFTKARDAAGLPKAMVLYTSRHGQLTDMGEVLPLAELMKLGGHVDARTAMRYQHPNVKDLQARLEAAKTTGRIQ